MNYLKLSWIIKLFCYFSYVFMFLILLSVKYSKPWTLPLKIISGMVSKRRHNKTKNIDTSENQIKTSL